MSDQRMVLDSRVLDIPQALLLAASAHAEECFPEECCGVLLGRIADGERLALRTERGGNVARRRTDRYLLSPEALASALHRGAREGLELVGFYHSHPDGPSRPSAADVDAAWPGASYLICGMKDGQVDEVRSWRLLQEDEDPGAGFGEETLRIVPGSVQDGTQENQP